jgi:hypothetical protein
MATKSLSLQRRHFEFIAAVIKDLRNEPYCCQRTLDAVAREFMRQLPRTNARFNADRFERACEVKAFCNGGRQ